ncbi:neuronal acetylcholine receptor subunit alpha-7-like isoform X1 [Centruroides vittatus]|uniref:neuronal acetylcholine receptor subunit alpha-7-like isoform X1 n=2 Tax=Centruroides vittatus TaxID=120091 RepID=UPI00350F4C49
MDVRRSFAAIILYHFYIFVFLYVCTDSSDVQHKSMIQKLRKDLLKNYDKIARPVLDDSNATTLYFGLIPIYLSEINEEKNYIKLEAWLQLTWTDHHLVWQPENYSGIELMHFEASEIWVPDISIYSSTPVTEIMPNVETRVLSFNGGTIIWVPTITIYSYCKINYKNYPNDIQECNITFGSWTHHGWALDLELSSKTINLNDFHNTNPLWTLIDSSVEKEINRYTCCPEPYPSIVTTFTFKRTRFSDYGSIIWCPSLIAIIFTLIMFWISFNLLYKLILGCTSVIILTVSLLCLSEFRSSPVATVLSAQTVHSTMFIVASAMLMEFFIVSLRYIYGIFRPPSAVIYCLSGIVGKIMLIKIPRKSFGIIHKTEENREFMSENYSEEWLLVSIALERICFLIYLLVFIVHKSI